MNYLAKQEELDVKKWLASEKKGSDACGDFDYCAHCDKSAEFPCAVASEKAAKAADSAKAPKAAPAAKAPVAKKPVAPKAEVAATAAPKTTAAKTPVAKNTTAKKA